MRKVLKDILYGLLIMFIITILEFLVTLPLGQPSDFNEKGYSYFINRELLLTSIPALVVTFLFTWFLKTKNKGEALRKSIIWTIIVIINYSLIGIGNDNFMEIFRTMGIYILIICTFIGPIFYARINHLV